MQWGSATHRDCYPDAVKRFVVTFKTTTGSRVLFGAAQGRSTYETREQAEQFLAAVQRNNSADILRQYADLQVRECACWAQHFDPCGIYFDVDDAQAERDAAVAAVDISQIWKETK